MKYLLIKHEVADYNAWKKVFDDATDIRRAAGEISYQVFKYDVLPNQIVHLSVWEDMARAKQFFESPELVKIRAEAGVKSPEFIYLDLLEAGVLQVKWFDRKFDFENNYHHISSLIKRLSATTSRLKELTDILSETKLSASANGKWSVNEHIGHLSDLEPLWQGRLADILNGEKEMRATDLQNTQTYLANHNATSLTKLLTNFSALRQQTILKVQMLSDEDASQSALHPRLKTPMRVIDHLLFVVEHDDHHLTSIKALL